MEKKITSFVPFSDKESLDHTVKSLKDSGVTAKIVIVAGIDAEPDFKDPVVFINQGICFTASAAKYEQLPEYIYLH
jgi:hypothetical protein